MVGIKRFDDFKITGEAAERLLRHAQKMRKLRNAATVNKTDDDKVS